MFDRYGPDVLAHPPEPTPAPEVTVERGLVVE